MEGFLWCPTGNLSKFQYYRFELLLIAQVDLSIAQADPLIVQVDPLIAQVGLWIAQVGLLIAQVELLSIGQVDISGVKRRSLRVFVPGIGANLERCLDRLLLPRRRCDYHARRKPFLGIGGMLQNVSGVLWHMSHMQGVGS